MVASSRQARRRHPFGGGHAVRREWTEIQRLLGALFPISDLVAQMSGQIGRNMDASIRSNGPWCYCLLDII